MRRIEWQNLSEHEGAAGEDNPASVSRGFGSSRGVCKVQTASHWGPLRPIKLCHERVVEGKLVLSLEGRQPPSRTGPPSLGR